MSTHSRRFSLTFKPKKKVAAATAAGTAKGQRQVHFKEDRNTVHEFEAIDKYDSDLLQTLWQQGWEMREAKDIIKVRAKQWRQTGMGVFLSDVFRCDHDLSPALCQKQLNTFCQLPDEMHMRGLERYLSRKHDEERTKGKRHVLQQVVTQFQNLQAQVRLKQLSQAESEQALADYCRRLNQDAALFASRMGQADQVVAQQGPAKNTKPALELVELKHQMALEIATRAPKGALKTAPIPAKLTTGRQLQARQA